MRASLTAFAALTLMTALPIAGCRPAGADPAPVAARPTLGLMSSLPIYWGEQAGGFGSVLTASAEPDWVRAALERRFVLEPLDTLEPERLRPLELLLLAQPRPLSPAENVALDDWVRGGGRLLLLADPMLTRHSPHPVGDPRRPQDVALLSPILAHWGMTLRFDADQADNPRSVDLSGTPIPLRLAGTIYARTGADCRLLAEAAIARCKRGRGRVVVVADAALLDDAAATRALETVTRLAYD